MLPVSDMVHSTTDERVSPFLRTSLSPVSAIHRVFWSAESTMSSVSRGVLAKSRVLLTAQVLSRKKIFRRAPSVLLSLITMKPELVATRPEISSSFSLLILQIFLPAVALALTVAVGVGSAADAPVLPIATRPTPSTIENTRRRIRTVSHAASPIGVTRGSTLVKGHQVSDFTP